MKSAGSTKKYPELGLTVKRETSTLASTLFKAIFSIQFISMIILTSHNAGMPFLVRAASKTPFLPTTSVFMMEVMKLIFCLFAILVTTRSFSQTAEKLYSSIWGNKMETLKVAIPAVVYAIQNNLYYIALANVDPTTYSVTLQLRILTTAILSVSLLGKILSMIQWLALFISLSGVVLVQLDQQKSTQKNDGNAFFGIIAVLGMCWTSAFAGVYFEKMLKNSKADLWTQNIRLSILTLTFAAITMLLSDAEVIYEGGMFQNWTELVWLVTFLNSVGGIVVSIVMKYADNVRKTYCQSMAIGLTALVSIFTGERLFSFMLLGGVGCVTASVVIYTLNPPPPPETSKTADDMITLLMEDFDSDPEI